MIAAGIILREADLVNWCEGEKNSSPYRVASCRTAWQAEAICIWKNKMNHKLVAIHTRWQGNHSLSRECWGRSFLCV